MADGIRKLADSAVIRSKEIGTVVREVSGMTTTNSKAIGWINDKLEIFQV